MGQTLPAGMIDILKSPTHLEMNPSTLTPPPSPALGLNCGLITEGGGTGGTIQRGGKKEKKENPEAHYVADLQREWLWVGNTPEGLSWLLGRRVELKQSKGPLMGSDRKDVGCVWSPHTHTRAAEQAWRITVNTHRNKYVQEKSENSRFPEGKLKRDSIGFVWLVS